MKFIKYLLTGIFFGIILSKAEVISWYRIYEMFNFHAFHMYGIIGTAVILGAISVAIIKKLELKDVDGNAIHIEPKPKTYKANLIGGSIFGMGWALTGACPGPLFVIAGQGYSVFFLVILSAILGTFLYGLLQKHLPH